MDARLTAGDADPADVAALEQLADDLLAAHKRVYAVRVYAVRVYAVRVYAVRAQLHELCALFAKEKGAGGRPCMMKMLAFAKKGERCGDRNHACGRASDPRRNGAGILGVRATKLTNACLCISLLYRVEVCAAFERRLAMQSDCLRFVGKVLIAAVADPRTMANRAVLVTHIIITAKCGHVFGCSAGAMHQINTHTLPPLCSEVFELDVHEASLILLSSRHILMAIGKYVFLDCVQSSKN